KTRHQRGTQRRQGTRGHRRCALAPSRPRPKAPKKTHRASRCGRSRRVGRGRRPPQRFLPQLYWRREREPPHLWVRKYASCGTRLVKRFGDLCRVQPDKRLAVKQSRRRACARAKAVNRLYGHFAVVSRAVPGNAKLGEDLGSYALAAHALACFAAAEL